eukprot:468588-Rhodomonas_salina.1
MSGTGITFGTMSLQGPYALSGTDKAYCATTTSSPNRPSPRSVCYDPRHTFVPVSLRTIAA